MMFLCKEHMGSARREVWLRKNYWEFFFCLFVYLFLKKQERRKKHFQYVHRILALVSSVLVQFLGIWRKAVLSRRWSWGTGRCSNCHHSWSQKLFQALAHAKKTPKNSSEEKSQIQEQILHRWIIQYLWALMLHHIDHLHSFPCWWGHKWLLHFLPACKWGEKATT